MYNNYACELFSEKTNGVSLTSLICLGFNYAVLIRYFLQLDCLVHVIGSIKIIKAYENCMTKVII